MNTTIRLNAVGDVMLGDFPLTLGFGVRSSILKSNDSNIFNGVKHILRNCDICFGNLETVLSDKDLQQDNIRSVQMRGNPASVGMLKDAGFNVMSVANNHAMQHGPEAFTETIEMLDQGGIVPVGLARENGRVAPHFMKVKGIMVSFLAYSLRPEKYSSQILYAKSNFSEIVEDIKSCKKESDLVILSLHWGDEFVQVPSPAQIQVAHSFVDAGVSLLVGHHPHIMQGIEKYKNSVIAYSLGNFVFDFWQNRMRKTIILQCELSRNGIKSCEYTAAYIKRNYCPEIMNEKQSYDMSIMMKKLSNKIMITDAGSYCSQIKYDLNVKAALMFNKFENRLYFMRNILRYKKWVVSQSLKGFVKARI